MVWQLLSQLKEAQGKSVGFSILSPKCLSVDELYGFVNARTGEWKDGFFSSIMRKQGGVFPGMQARSAESSSSNMQWIILDGDVDPLWIETLNTVMDDNKILTLMSNERIPLKSNMRIIVESLNLCHATPATVSRGAVMHINDDEIGWQPFVNSWLKTYAEAGVRFPLHAHLSSLRVICSTYLKAATSVLSSDARLHNVMLNSCFSSVQSTLCMFGSIVRRFKSSATFWTIDSIEVSFIYAILWGFAAPLTKPLQRRFTDALRDFLVQDAVSVEKDDNGPKHVLFAADEPLQLELSVDPTTKQVCVEQYVRHATGGTLSEASSIMNLQLPMQSMHDGTPEGANTASGLSPPSLSSLCMPTVAGLSILNALALYRQSWPCPRPCALTGENLGKTVILRHFVSDLVDNGKDGSRGEFDGLPAVPWQALEIGLHSQTSAIGLQGMIESKLERKAGNTFAPKGNGQQRLMVFVDDLGLPEADAFGTQACLTMLHHSIDCGQLYDRSRIVTRLVKDVHYVGTIRDVGSASLLSEQRLLHRFARISMPETPEAEVESIFVQVLTAHLTECYVVASELRDTTDTTVWRDFESDSLIGSTDDDIETGAKAVAGRLVSACMSFHRKVRARFSRRGSPAAAAASLDPFRLHLFATLVQGLLQTTPSTGCEADVLAQLWLHECTSTYCGYLRSPKDVGDLESILKNVCRETLLGSSKGYHEASTTPPAALSYGERIVDAWQGCENPMEMLSAQDMTMTSSQGFHMVKFWRGLLKPESEHSAYVVAPPDGELQHLFEAAISNGSNGRESNDEKGSVVLFEQAVTTILALSRMLFLNDGHVMVMGAGGSGRHTLSSMAAIIAGISSFVDLDQCSAKGEDSAKDEDDLEDLRQAYARAGARQERVVVSISISHCYDAALEPSEKGKTLLPILNDFVSTGDYGIGGCSLFGAEEMDGFLESLRPQVRRSGLMDSAENCRRCFVSNARAHLHLNLIVDPSNDVRFLSRYFPLLYKRSVMVQVRAWNSDALRAVAEKVLLPVEDLLSISLKSVESSVYSEIIEREQLHMTEAAAVVETLRSSSSKSSSSSSSSTMSPTPSSIARYFESAYSAALTVISSVTPFQYLRSLTEFCRLLKLRREHLISRMKRLASGRFKMALTSRTATQMEVRLQEAQKDVARNVDAAEQKRKALSKERAIVDAEVERASEEARTCEIIRAEVVEKERNANEELQSALPMLQDAESALNSIDKNSLIELKSFKNPHSDVLIVMQAVMTLLSGVIPGVHVGERDIQRVLLNRKGPSVGSAFLEDSRKPGGGSLEWHAIQRQMRDVRAFVSVLRSFSEAIEAGQVPEANFKNVVHFLHLSAFNVDQLWKKSRAASGICAWVINLKNFHKVWADVQPKRAHLAHARERMLRSEEELMRVRKRVEDMKVRLVALTDQYAEATTRKGRAVKRMNDLRNQLELSRRLISSLAGEGERWAMLSSSMQAREADPMCALMALGSTFSAYAGGMTFSERLASLRLWLTKVQKNGLLPGGLTLTTRGGDALGGSILEPVSILASESRVAEWRNTFALPKDVASVENIAILDTASATCVPYIIDPHGQCARFIKAIFAQTGSERLCVISDFSSDISAELDKLGRAIEDGDVVLLEGIDGGVLPESMMPLFREVAQRRREWIGGGALPSSTLSDPERSGTLSGGRDDGRRGNGRRLSSLDQYRVTTIGNRLYSIHPRFRLLLSSPIRALSTEIRSTSLEINFALTQRGLTEQLLQVTVGIERNDLERQKSEIERILNSSTVELRHMEDRVLELLSTSPAEDSENSTGVSEELVATLEESISAAKATQEKVKENEALQEKVSEAREKYRPAACRGATLFFLLTKLGKIDSLYQFSLDNFILTFSKAVGDAHNVAVKVLPRAADLGKNLVSGLALDCNPQMATSAKTMALRQLFSRSASDVPLTNLKTKTKTSSTELKRIREIMTATTYCYFTSTVLGLRMEHRLSFAFAVALDLIVHEAGDMISMQMLHFLTSITSFSSTRTGASPVEWMSVAMWNKVIALSEMDVPTYDGDDFSFVALPNDILDSPERWQEFCQKPVIDLTSLPGVWKKAPALQQLCIVQAIAPEKFASTVRGFLKSHAAGLGASFMDALTRPPHEMIDSSSSSIALLLLVAEGSSTFAVLDKIEGLGYTIERCSLGAGMIERAESLLLRSCGGAGECIFLQNVHLV
eukprot:g5078.t1